MSNDGDGNVGRHLAHDQFQRADRRDDELLDRAALALAHDRRGGEHGGQHHQDHADQRRDHVVGADQIGVVPHLCAHLHRRLRRARLAARGGALHHDVRRLRLPDHRRRGERGAGDARVRAVDHKRHLGLLPAGQPLAVVGRDDQPGPRLAAVDQPAQLRLAVHVVGHHEIIGGAIGVEQGARRGRTILIQHGQRHVAHVVGRRVAQQEQLHHRHDQRDPQGARVAHDLDELFADQGEQSAEVYRHGVAPSAAASPGARYSIPRRKVSTVIVTISSGDRWAASGIGKISRVST